ncbi:MAG: hypothetical protein CMF67_03285 [Magnetovibrio sp.]|nr:hypothetical protein [Magnetovibrio sp.]
MPPKAVPPAKFSDMIRAPVVELTSSLVRPVLEARNKSPDQKHEFAMLYAQAEMQSKIQYQKLEPTIVEADMAEFVAAHKEEASTVRREPTCLSNPGVRSCY